jgi:lipid-A-disaccharide synthase
MAATVYFIAGELSGDMHGAAVMRAMNGLRPGLEFAGAGGPAMRELGGERLRDWVDDAAVVGVWEVLKRYSWFKARFFEMLEEIRTLRPAVLVLIDYPGFNLRMASAVRAAIPEIRIVYYISPQVWAWHKGRIPKMARILDRMLCIFPFEEKLFAAAGLPTTFVGHPLVDQLAARTKEVPRENNLVGLFPGSREREIDSLFPLMLETARRLAVDHPERRFEAPAASPRLAERMGRHLAAAQFAPGGPVTITVGGSHDLMQRATCAVIASGTATLEAARLGLPYCLVYKVAWLTFLLAKMVIKVPHIGLVNILAGREVVKEYLQSEADPAHLQAALERFLTDPEHLESVRAQVLEAAARLGSPGGHQRAAAAILEYLPAGATNCLDHG